MVLMVGHNMERPAGGVVGMETNEVRFAVLVLAMGASVATLAATDGAPLLLSAKVLDRPALHGRTFVTSSVTSL